MFERSICFIEKMLQLGMSTSKLVDDYFRPLFVFVFVLKRPAGRNR